MLKRSWRRASSTLVIPAALVMSACGALIGINDLTPGGPETGLDGSSESTTPDGGGDGPIITDGDPNFDGGDGSCGDTVSSKDNCGRCGHSCLGGDCEQGVCKPVTLATNQGTVAGIAIDGTHVYFASTSRNVISRVPKAGGAVESIANSKATLAKRVALSPNYVYWTADGFPGVVARCSLTGCIGAPDELATPSEPIGIAVTATHVYWADRNGKKIMKKGVLAGAEQLVATPSDLPVDVAVDGQQVFFIEDFSGTVERLNPTDGGVIEIGANGQSGRTLVLDPTYVYWGAAQDPGLPGKISRAPRAGGGPVDTLNPAEGDPGGMALDSAYLYWTATRTLTDGGTNGGGVYRCDLPTCASGATTLATQDLPKGIAVDETAIYWGGNGVVMKLAKP